MASLPLELALLTASPPPPSPLPSLEESLKAFSSGDYVSILTGTLASALTSPPSLSSLSSEEIISTYRSHLQSAISTSSAHPLELLLLGIAALNAYVQATATGPPLQLKEQSLLPSAVSSSKTSFQDLKDVLIRSLSVDGESAYHLLPFPLVFTLAKEILTSDILSDSELTTIPWWRARVNLLHQRILRESSSSLHDSIYSDLSLIESTLSPQLSTDTNLKALYLIERSRVHSFYGYDSKVIADLESAAGVTGLQYALTGRLGKRTKFQVNDIAQLVVLAKSKQEYKIPSTNASERLKPETLDLNDDTLLESISFTPSTAQIVDEDDLPASLKDLNPGEQPILQPLDSIILLHLAESIKNTNPEDGLTREQMSPYAERVLAHSTNWSIHTVGLLVRSRLEAYRNRTMQRSLLQLQAVVDQVIAATAGEENATGVSTFLPKPKENESAGVTERLEFGYALGVQSRWSIEAELAARWVHVGGLKTAVGIYERLGMWAEVALCWAGVEKEEKAVKIVKRMLYEGKGPRPDDEDELEDEEDVYEKERDPAPAEAPRLWCILGDLERRKEWYEKAWEVSGCRYARAQRSLGIHWLREGEFGKAIEAYKLALKTNPLNGGTWFQCGVAMMEVGDWDGAVAAFTRVVGLEEADAEGWSNLATGLLRRGKVGRGVQGGSVITLDDEEDMEGNEEDEVDAENEGKIQALRALQKAVGLKATNWRMWENYLTIAASTKPPSWGEMQTAIRRLIDIRGQKEGESCIDVGLLNMLVQHVIRTYETVEPGLARITVDLVEGKVVPLITNNERLWGVVRDLAVWRKRLRNALEAQEKAFRIVSGRYDVRTDKTSWEELVKETEEMVRCYKEWGPEKKETDGELVMKDWKFKAKVLVRGVMGKGRKAGWDEDETLWTKLETLSEELTS